MKLDTYGCHLSPHCQPDMENMALIGQIIFYGIAGLSVVVGPIVLVAFIIIAFDEAVAIARRLLGLKYPVAGICRGGPAAVSASRVRSATG